MTWSIGTEIWESMLPMPNGQYEKCPDILNEKC